MTDDERQRYDEALFGTATTRVAITNDAGKVISDVPGAGCVNDAYVKVYSGTIQDYSQRADVIMRPWNELRSSIDSDDRTMTAMRQWADCMNRAGYEFTSSSDVKPYLETLGLSLAAGRPLEIAIRDADKACDDEVGLATTLADVRAAWELDFLNRFPELSAFANRET